MSLIRNDFAGSRTVFTDGDNSSTSLSDFLPAHKSINKKSIFDFLLFGTVLPPRSPLSGVSLLFPGETIENGRHTSEYTSCAPQIQKQDVSVFVNEFEHILEAYFEKHKTQKPTLLLSGGVDSAIIASFLGADARCITWGDPDDPIGDATYAKMTTQAFSISQHHIVPPDRILDKKCYDKTVTELALPLLFQNSVPHVRMANFAKKHGIDSWFVGQNADTVLVSYPAPYLVNRLVPLNRVAPFNPLRLWPNRKRYVFSTDSIVRLMAYFKSSGIFPGPWMDIPDGYFEEKEAYLQKTIKAKSLMQRIILTEEILTEARRNQIYQGEISSVYGIDANCPYYDRAFIELALSLPYNLRSRDHFGKVVFKELARKRGVPEAVILRKKTGLTSHYRAFFKAGHHLSLWDEMERDEFMNHFIDIRRIREKRESNRLTFDHLASLYYWKELVYKKQDLCMS